MLLYPISKTPLIIFNVKANSLNFSRQFAQVLLNSENINFNGENCQNFGDGWVEVQGHSEKQMLFFFAKALLISLIFVVARTLHKCYILPLDLTNSVREICTSSLATNSTFLMVSLFYFYKGHSKVCSVPPCCKKFHSFCSVPTFSI